MNSRLLQRADLQVRRIHQASPTIDRLPIATRHALYERTLSTLGEFCDPKKALHGLDAYCHQQADFAAEFPECGDSCRALTTQHHRLAVR